MLTKQGNTQIYSLFGSYVVEQHRAACERPERCVHEPSAPEPESPKSKEMAKAA